jgi:hypothetical protein
MTQHPFLEGEAFRTATVYEVVYYEAVNDRWRFAARFPTREEADAKADEIRLAGYEARVTEETA